MSTGACASYSNHEERSLMRQVISNDTGKELKLDGSMKTDVSVDADGEGGIFLGMRWHEMVNLGSVVTRIKPDEVKVLIEAIKKASEDID
jgi:hypothetical protein